MMRRTVKGIACAVAAALAVGALAGCASGKEDRAASEGAPDALAPLSVAYLNKAGYEDIIVAGNQGFFDGIGTEVSLYTVSGSGQQSVEAMLAGSADIAVTGKGPAGSAIAQYGDEIVVLAGTNITTGDQVWVAGPDMTGETQLVAYDAAKDNKDEVRASYEAAAEKLGGTIRAGVQKGATTESDYKSWLKAMGISYNDFGTDGAGVVTLVDVKANTLPTTLATGSDIDIMAASQPYPDTAIAQIAGAYVLGSNADTNSYGVEFLLTTKKVYEEKQDSIKALLAALQTTAAFMNDNPEQAIEICAQSIGTDEANVKAAFASAHFGVALNDDMIATLEKVCAKNGADLTSEDLKALMPLYDWVNGAMA